MSSSNEAEIQISIEEANETIDFAKSLDKLHKNRDFKKVILEGYFKEEAIRLVNLKADPAVQSPERQESIIQAIDAIGALRNFFGTAYQKASWAEGAIDAAEEELEALRNEEG